MPNSSMKRKRAFTKLQSAIERTKMVRITRTLDDAERIDGYVVAISDDWVLLARTTNDMDPDGWTALRIRDLFAIDKLGEGDSDVQARILAATGHWPPAAPSGCLITDLAGVIRTATGTAQLIAVHREVARPDSMWVGVARSVDEENLFFLELDPNARWESSVTQYDSDDITRVDFGGRYLGNIARVMGEVPSR